MGNNNNSIDTRQTVVRSIEIIELLAKERCLGVTQIANEMTLAKSTVHAYLKTLVSCGYVVREDEKYCLAFRISLLGESVKDQSRLFTAGRDELKKLADQTGLYTHLSVKEHHKNINICQIKGGEISRYKYQNNKLRRPEPLHFTATGKAILASLPEEEAALILDQHNLTRQTPNTITDIKKIEKELEKIQKQGYSQNDEEEVIGFRAVGAPVRDRADGSLGAVSVSGPKSLIGETRFNEELPKKITRVANMIQLELNMDESSLDRL